VSYDRHTTELPALGEPYKRSWLGRNWAPLVATVGIALVAAAVVVGIMVSLGPRGTRSIERVRAACGNQVAAKFRRVMRDASGYTMTAESYHWARECAVGKR
jgi:hypothetical protein